MARHLFGPPGVMWQAAGTSGPGGAPTVYLAPAAVFTLWNQPTGGSPYTDITAADGITAISLVADATGEPPWLRGPDGVDAMYCDTGASVRMPMIAVDSMLDVILNAPRLNAAGSQHFSGPVDFSSAPTVNGAALPAGGTALTSYVSQVQSLADYPTVIAAGSSQAAARAAIGADASNAVVTTRTASYTAVAVDAGTLIEMNVATANTLTINAGVFSANQKVRWSQYGAGVTTFVAGSGMTLRSTGGSLVSAGQYSGGEIRFRSASEAILSGNLAAPSGGVSVVPDAPINVVALPDNTSAVICFTPPKVTNGGSNALSAITSYTATSSPGGFTGTGTASGGITVSGLTNGTAYTFTLTASNSTGTSVASAASNSVTPNARITISAPTGGADATGAIQTAIDGAASGRAVFLPAGTYTLTSAGVVAKAGVRFFGAGDTTILTGTRTMYMPTNSSIDHMKLTCGSINATALWGFDASVTGARVENCTFIGYGTNVGFGIWINGDGTNRQTGWTIRSCSFSNYSTALYFKPTDSLLLDQCSISGADGTQNTLFWGGSNNNVSNNTIAGGITGVAFLHFRGSQKTYADRGVSFSNTIFRNTITNISEEGISFDVIGNLAANVAALDNGNIASKPGSNQITMSGGSWATAGTTEYVGYYACWMTGTNRGKTAKITTQSNGTLTLDVTNIVYSTVAVGDRVAFGAPFMYNVVEQNSVTLKAGSGTVGIDLYGLCYNNTVKNNFATGSPTDDAIAIYALAALLASDINHSGTANGVAPTGYNTVDNNTTSGYDITAKVLDFGSGNKYQNYGDSLTRNTITTSGAVRADWHQMATSGAVGDPGVAILNTAPGGTVLTNQT